MKEGKLPRGKNGVKLKKTRRYFISLSAIIFTLSTVSVVVLLISFLTTAFLLNGDSKFYYSLEIGDILGNSSSLIEVTSIYTRSSSITFSTLNEQQPYTIILLSVNMPSTITDYLPLEQFPLLSEVESEYRGDFNYLGSNEPIYLLSGSSIKYNLTITSINTTYTACLYLFASEIYYNNFLMTINSSNLIYYNNSHCFMSANTTEPSTASFSFNITSAGQYYVGIQLQTGVAVQANASVVRIYYNTTGLQQQTSCSGRTSCSIDLCNTFVCSHEAITYFLIKPSNRTSIIYFFTSPKINFDIFIAYVMIETFYVTLIIVTGCFLCCFLCHGKSRCRSTAKNTLHKKQSRRGFFSVNAHNKNDAKTISLKKLIQEPPSKSDDDKNFLLHNEKSRNKTDLNIPSTDNQHSDNRFISFTSFIKNFSSSDDVNEACTIETNLPLPEVEIVQASLLSCENDSTSSQSQFDMESMCYTGKHSLTNRTSDQTCNTANEKLFLKIKDAFGELQKLSLDSSGLVYHCSQYGVTLIIPEGAVQESAIVWFGACLFSDKFKFGDYVPVTPILWVHIDRKLDKCAELYIPHDVAISSDINVQQFTVLTAHDDDCSDVISFQQNYGSKVQVSPGLFQILSPHFCSNCIAIQKRKYKTIPRRYLIARADKKNGSRELVVQFIFLCQQKGCKKVVEEQCAKEGFRISSWEPVTITGDGRVSLSFEPYNVPGWKREEVGFSKNYISIEDIDYYQMMGCENSAEVTEDELERLEVLEDILSYPPRFRIQFISDAVVEKSAKMMVQFNQVHPPWKNMILLEGSIELPLSPSPSKNSSIDVIPHANDLLLGDCLRIIASEGDLREKWFDFGYKLNVTLNQLQEIESTGIDFIRCTRKVIIHWRDQNRSESWEPLAVALAKIGFKDLAHRVKDHFDSISVLESKLDDDYKGVYCKLCNDYHLKPEEIQEEVPSTKYPPNMVDLINLVAAKIQDKFYQFGTALHLDDSFLKSLYDTYHDPMDRFIAVFNRWKDNGPDAYTWSTVINVLQSDAIGAHAVAQDVTKHLTTTNAEAEEHASN